ncbi:MAG: hypothetical protein ABSA11_15775 [Candidatus Bathyarchaeia archaeon]
MDRIEILLDVLEANGFPSIRSKMREREDELMRGATFRNILNAEEIEVVRKVLREFKVPSPTGWAHAMMVHGMRQDIERFSEDNVYDYTELCNLSFTLREAGLADKETWRKIENAKNSMKKYTHATWRDS